MRSDIVPVAIYAHGGRRRDCERPARPDKEDRNGSNPPAREDIDWKPFPAFPPSVRLAIVVGQPSEPGPYVIRVKVPPGV
jgi:hypothetical protein